MSDKQENVTKTRMTLQPRHQLIDLNKEYVNCEINFQCKAADASKDFEVLVVNQDQLDTIDLNNLDMKKTRGGFVSGNIVADENKAQNYFLVIRGINEEPLDVDVDIRVFPIEPNPQKIQSSPASIVDENPSSVSDSHRSKWYSIPMQYKSYLLALLVILIVAAIIYFYVYKNKNTDHPIDDSKSETLSQSSHSSRSSTKSSLNKEDIEKILLGKK